MQVSQTNKVIEYWDSVAENNCPTKTNIICDNWHKRQQIVRHLLKYNFIGKKIIEVGCGIGITAATIRFAAGMPKYSGFDISQRFCNVAKHILNLNVKYGEIIDIPAESCEFDCIFLFDVLEHIGVTDRQKAFMEVDRVLKDSAMIFINNPITKSGHPEQFDYGFDENDLAHLCKTTSARIEEVSIIRIKPKNKLYEYQFIVLKR